MISISKGCSIHLYSLNRFKALFHATIAWYPRVPCYYYYSILKNLLKLAVLLLDSYAVRARVLLPAVELFPGVTGVQIPWSTLHHRSYVELKNFQ